MGQDVDKYRAVSELARRRGFFWSAYEIYGGSSGFVTYGPLGSRLKQNIEKKVRALFVNRLGIFEIESPIIAPSRVFEASGHVSHFKEPMIECSGCSRRFRADHLLREFAGVAEADAEKLSLGELKDSIRKSMISCPECGGAFGEPKNFLTMFKTRIGPYSDAVGYGRPEAAQGIFVEFRRLSEIARGRFPFGVVQIGHALRNEISPRQGLIRLREFTIIDLEFFFDPVDPDCFLLDDVKNETVRLLLAETRLRDSEEITEVVISEALAKGYIKAEWQAVFMVFAKRLLIDLGVPADMQRFIEKLPWEKAHYALQSFDQEVFVDRWGWVEVSGHAYRTDYDLKSHMESSGVDIRLFKDSETLYEKESCVVKPVMEKLGPVYKGKAEEVSRKLLEADPEEIESSMKRTGHYLLGDMKILPEYVKIIRRKVKSRGRHFIPHVVEPSFGSDRMVYVALEYAYKSRDDRVVLSLPRAISPWQIGVYPLVSKNGLKEKSLDVHRMLLDEGFAIEFDEAGSIGRRYARADEIGTPLGITIDYRTLEDDTVTIRDRDSWRQVRSRIEDLSRLLPEYFSGRVGFGDLGKLVGD